MGKVDQLRLPGARFEALDDLAEVYARGRDRFRRRFDPECEWPEFSARNFVHINPEKYVPLLAKDIAIEAPESSSLSDPIRVRHLFNILALSEGIEPEYALIPYVPIGPLDNRGEV